MSLAAPSSHVTNRRDAASLKSRVFIGNLQTALVSKRDVEVVFSRYGRVLGCSVHKGYAFVQYVTRDHAHAAVRGHHGRVLAGRTLDINMAGEAKPKQDKTAKRPIASLDHSDCQQQSDGRLFHFHSGRHVVPVKCARVSPPGVRRPSSLPAQLPLRSSNVLLHARATGRADQLQVIRRQLTQIKENIDALLGRLERITRRARARARAAVTVHEEQTTSQRHHEEDDDEDDDEGDDEGDDERNLAVTENSDQVERLAHGKPLV
ncbi:RNA-binding protein Raly isoform X2 [Festucalex cinctus]